MFTGSDQARSRAGLRHGGVPVVFHDESLYTACGLNEEVGSLSVDEVTALKYRATDEQVTTLNAALSLCSQLRLGVMLDISASGSESYYSGIAELVEKCGLARATVTITQDALARRQLERCMMLAVSREDRARIEAGEKVDLGSQFWFAAAGELETEHVGSYKDARALVLPAINTFRYPSHAHRQIAEEDIVRLSRAGVHGFQIDSVSRILSRSEAPESATTDLPPDPAARNPASRGRC